MKNKGIMIVEVIIAISLFSISIFPLLEFNRQLLQINRNILRTEKIYKNYTALQKQLLSKDFLYFKENLGYYELTKANHSFIENIVFPYGIENFFTDNNTTLKIEIIPSTIYSNIEKYDYIILKILYINNNKSFVSEYFISNLRR